MLIRHATEADVPAVAHLLADDFLGAAREELGPPLPGGYLLAFREIAKDPNAALFVAEVDGEVVATFQMDFMRRMSRAGKLVAEIESVHVRNDKRGHGIGQKLIAFAIAEARARGVHRVQLTSDKQREDAHRFYERLGFAASHEGFKLVL